jgi:hypothetical protein
MAFRPVQVIRGKAVQVEGLPALQARIRDLMDKVSPGEVMAAGLSMSDIVGEAADDLYNEVFARAMAAGVPHDVMDDIFSYKRQPPGLSRKEITALVGIRKRGRKIGSGIQRGTKKHPPPRVWAGRAYREWFAGGSWGSITGGYLHKSGKRVLNKGLATGRLVGESLATMWELGTSKMAARPFFRPAVMAVRTQLVARIAAGFNRIIEQLSKAA